MKYLASYSAFLMILHSVFANPTPSLTQSSTMSQLSDPSSNFGFKFLNQINKNQLNRNALVSPFSIQLAFGMLLEGSSGQTKDQIINVLGLSSLSNDSSVITKANKKILGEYKLIENGSSNRNFSLVIGNLIMLNKQLTQLKEAYQSSVINNYLAEATSEDFSKGNQVLTKINSWVAEKTKNKIVQLISSPPPPETVLMLINTVYFKGKWELPFLGGQTTEKTFHNSDGTESQVQMMHQYSESFPYVNLADKQLKVLELPYHGNVSMLIMLPTGNNTLTNVISTLNATELKNIVNSLSKDDLTVVAIPKLKLEDDHQLDQILKQMGMTLPFSDQAELHQIADFTGLRVSKSSQKALIEIDEKGAEATAATLIRIYPTSARFPPPDNFIADRPFLFIIRDKISGINLFIGQVNKMMNATS